MTAQCDTIAYDVSYDTYRQWALEHGKHVLTPAQYRAWCSAINESWEREGYASVAADQSEIDRELAEGWAADRQWGL